MSAILAHERSCWARLRWDYAPTSRLIEHAVGTRGVSGFALLGTSGDAVAYAYYLASIDRSVIGSVHALPEGEAHAGAAILLDRCLAHLVRDVGARRIESQFLHFGREDLAPIYRSWGARAYEREFLSAPLSELRARDPVPTVTVRPFRSSDTTAAAEVIYRSFLGSIDAAMSQCYASTAGCKAFVEGVALRDGCGLFDRDSSVVHETHDGIDGVLLSSRVGTGVGHVVQVSVAPEAQGRGVGRSLLAVSAARGRSQPAGGLRRPPRRARQPHADAIGLGQ